MRKFINFCKKPLLIATASVFGLFLIMLIVVCAIPRGNKYEYNKTFFGQSINMSFSFEDGKMVADTSGMTGEEDIQVSPVEYKIEKGILYSIENGISEKVGKINSFKIVVDVNDIIENMKKEFEQGTEGSENPYEPGEIVDVEQMSQMIRFIFGKEIVLKCNLTIALRTTSIVFVSVFGVIAALCVVLLILDKKGVIKYKEDKMTETNVETLPTTVEE